MVKKLLSMCSIPAGQMLKLKEARYHMISITDFTYQRLTMLTLQSTLNLTCSVVLWITTLT